MTVSISENAAKHVTGQLQARGKGIGIRVGVTTTGCSGMAYVLEFVDKIEVGDQVFEDQGVKIIVLGSGVNATYNNGGTIVYPWKELAVNTNGSWNENEDPSTINAQLIASC